jgi:PncC family amidohydrolase
MEPFESIKYTLGRLLKVSAKTLSTAESCTGGLIGDMLTDVPGSSNYYLGGIIAYSNDAKMALLGVPTEVLSSKGAVSAETAASMAQGARRAFGSNFALSCTGIAGPEGGTPEKPVGLVYIGLAEEDSVWTKQYLINGSRREVKRQAAEKALEMLLEHLSRQPDCKEA